MGLVPDAAQLKRYRRHQLAAGALFWLPTTFLFLVDRLGPMRALQVQAVYYVAVVVLEVPSGWLSDRVGRVVVLRLVAAWWIVAHALFLSAPGPVGLVAGQVFLAAGYAFLSGTDVTFHHDTLEALGRADEFPAAEAASRRRLLLVTAASAVAGGALGLVDLRLPFAAALVAAVTQLGLAARLTEPPRTVPPGTATRRRFRFADDVAAVVAHLRTPLLGWLALYVVSQVTVVHLAADMTGPYLAGALDTGLADAAWAAPATGMVAAVVALAGALVVRWVPGLCRVAGLSLALLVLATVPVGVLVAMAFVSSVWLLPVLSLRGVQGAATSVVVPALVGSRVEQHRRATFLSLTSLGGRLVYGAALVGVAAAVDDAFETALVLASVIALALWVVTVAARSAVPAFPAGLDHDHAHEHEPVVHDHLHTHDDGHHDHVHDPPVTGAHRHEHRHRRIHHAHSHTRDLHHAHDHR